MRILVTGGAGYIGSILVEELVQQGNQVVVLDNLSQGHQRAVDTRAKFIKIELSDLKKLNQIFGSYNIQAVIHLAAKSIIGQSMIEPQPYFQNNIVYGMNLLDAMMKHSVKKIVFSSSAAVYGHPKKMPITEKEVTKPVNPYGESKSMFEKILHWYGQAYGLMSTSLRYFNAAGATLKYGEDHNLETHLIPNILKVALGQSPYVAVFGNDYPTRDGTCVRDYIHVFDIAKAHILALKHLENKGYNKVYNLGCGKGYSVNEVIEAAKKITNTQIKTKIHCRRPGDPVVLVADPKLAQRQLGWSPLYSDMENIIDSAWRWQKAHPHGYKEDLG